MHELNIRTQVSVKLKMSLTLCFTSKAPERWSIRQLFATRAKLVRTIINYNHSLKKPSVATQWISRGARRFAVDKYTDKIPYTMPSKRKTTFESKRRACKAIVDGLLPELPSKPPGLFGLFVSENYSKVQGDVASGKSPTEILTHLSMKWKTLSSAEKVQLKHRHDVLKEEYKREVMNLWKGLNTERRVLLEKLQGPKLRQLANARQELLGYPKKPPSSFLLFVQKNTDIVNASSVIERTKKLGEKWKEMSADEKEVFFMESLKANEQYLHDVVKWKEKHPEATTNEDI